MYSSYEESILSNTIVGAILLKSSYISLCLLVSAIIKSKSIELNSSKFGSLRSPTDT